MQRAQIENITLFNPELHLFTYAQTKIDTIPYSDIYFERIERIDFNEFEIIDTLENPNGFIVEGKNSKKVIIQNGNEFKSFNIPYEEINGGNRIEITRKEIIEGGYEELIVRFTYQNGKSFDSNGYSETTKGIEIFDLTNNKLIFSIDY